ncbi:MAG: anti-sigma regulatory factor (Ser/Thr protein kinase) [Candidatus Atelocyanobacterium thalassa isolate SIO64986]|uniref:Anti-sigma regulatory factor (Ser/Thr protein kinase) n=1 Tax=Candidatus Atelocyanobacterium thalassa isolate SIO64986 TaxID=1527444 RepID=A0A086CHW8_9CHRO|nr:MAG: anti-sigma regulatory factor (Ser/Thr protein kinase) [Candidatus Atelocyanobacterium thalassa isolate SIO64986]
MVAISLPPTKRYGRTMSFTSTLYLFPILDLLLTEVPDELRPEIRLGLQEALVNAAKHGNKLDPSKFVVVQFFINENDGYSWIIADQGVGFTSHNNYKKCATKGFPSDDSENGRGFYVLNEIFDQVHWDQKKTQLRLSKHIKKFKTTTFSFFTLFVSGFKLRIY